MGFGVHDCKLRLSAMTEPFWQAECSLAIQSDKVEFSAISVLEFCFFGFDPAPTLVRSTAAAAKPLASTASWSNANEREFVGAAAETPGRYNKLK
jgi:hypothetical protein